MVHPSLITGGKPIHNDHSRKERVEQCVRELPKEHYKQSQEKHPLQRNIDLNTVICSLLPFCTGSSRTNAVYILECIHSANWRGAAVRVHKKMKTDRWGDEIDSASRLIYVGSTNCLYERIRQHINPKNSRGADFTQIFPPVRVLGVVWFETYREAHNCEKVVADKVRDRFPDSYVMQS